MITKIPADGFMIAHGASGFVVVAQQADFAAQTSPEQGLVLPLEGVVEIRCSPIVAKQFLHALAANVGQYEDQFGEIKMPPMGPPGKAN